eukprot:TRINITY_DN3021_c0_g1_i3.p1 TRINITY_DN3021_c0_g1~~TRINITY_DN3021_c0_g1_i3.p1  ORF type:complete len:500 (-),score=103.35 TRINITY_DN3021_c0_g1_i3:180-1679(-)
MLLVLFEGMDDAVEVASLLLLCEHQPGLRPADDETLFSHSRCLPPSGSEARVDNMDSTNPFDDSDNPFLSATDNPFLPPPTRKALPPLPPPDAEPTNPFTSSSSSLPLSSSSSSSSASSSSLSLPPPSLPLFNPFLEEIPAPPVPPRPSSLPPPPGDPANIYTSPFTTAVGPPTIPPPRPALPATRAPVTSSAPTTTPNPAPTSTQRPLSLPPSKPIAPNTSSLTTSSSSINVPSTDALLSEVAALKRERDELRVQLLSSSPRGHAPEGSSGPASRRAAAVPADLSRYRSMQEKEGLMKDAVSSSSSRALMTVIIYCQNTLTSQLFYKMIARYPLALAAHLSFLHKKGDVEQTLVALRCLGRTSEEVALLVTTAGKTKDLNEKRRLLDSANTLCTSHGLEFYGEQCRHHLSLLHRQWQIEQYDAKMAAQGDPIYLKHPRGNIIGVPLGVTLEYCSFYHPTAPKDKLSSPAGMVEAYGTICTDGGAGGATIPLCLRPWSV